MADANGVVLLIDDQPVSGSSLAKAAREVARCGVRRTALVPVLALDRESALVPACAWLAPIIIHPGASTHANVDPVLDAFARG